MLKGLLFFCSVTLQSSHMTRYKKYGILLVFFLDRIKIYEGAPRTDRRPSIKKPGQGREQSSSVSTGLDWGIPGLGAVIISQTLHERKPLDVQALGTFNEALQNQVLSDHTHTHTHSPLDSIMFLEDLAKLGSALQASLSIKTLIE